jgi:hypothetical protein
MTYFEKALDYWPNHAAAVVGLSNLLLDLYEGNMTREWHGEVDISTAQSLNNNTEGRDIQRYPSVPGSMTNSVLGVVSQPSALSRSQTGTSVYQEAVSIETKSYHGGEDIESEEGEKTSGLASEEAINQNGKKGSESNDSGEATPEQLDGLAARDRGYFLLSSLTKLGVGWDCSEAWIGLARAYEASGQTEKAKEVLWWCVELEDSRPLRRWQVVGFL